MESKLTPGKGSNSQNFKNGMNLDNENPGITDQADDSMDIKTNNLTNLKNVKRETIDPTLLNEDEEDDDLIEDEEKWVEDEYLDEDSELDDSILDKSDGEFLTFQDDEDSEDD